jgi:hypothetical protein
MHYRCEIILPPNTKDIEAAITSVMEPFSENAEERSSGAFWDWWVIGGRFSGAKIADRLGDEVIDKFVAWCREEKVTVSGVQCGKQTLQPADQREKVDAKWREMTGLDGSAIIFDHFKGDVDTMRLGDCVNVTAARVIIAAPGYNHEIRDWNGSTEAEFMVTKDMWNGVTWQSTTWDGRLDSAVAMFRERSESLSERYKERINLSDDSFVVTVDYHN